MKPAVLFRKGFDEESEFEVCRRHFDTYQQRTEIPNKRLVIGRYSVLPYYKELSLDLDYNGSKLINTYKQHCNIADMSWADTSGYFTPQ